MVNREPLVLKPLHDYYEMSSLWIGRDYRSTSNPLNGALVIGHSTYGTPDNDPPGIIAWIKREKHDQTFTVFFNQTTTTSLRATDASIDDRADFFHSMAFLQLVPHSLVEKDRSPTAAEYRQRLASDHRAGTARWDFRLRPKALPPFKPGYRPLQNSIRI
jgi:hypothetical protein